MEPYRYPSVFLSHGTPMHAFGEDAYQEAVFAFAQSFPKPKSILFMSSHNVSNDKIHILKTETNAIQHDFSGFPPDLYAIKYSCPGSPELADQAAKLLEEAAFETQFDTHTPLDHGIWIPLRHMYPAGDVPLVRVSLPLSMTAPQILKVGHTLAKLREQGILVVSSGGAVHNLKELKWSEKHGPGLEYAKAFEDFLIGCLKYKDVEALLAADEHPSFARAHPSPEHFLPIYFTVGAALSQDEMNMIYRGIEYGSLSMLCFSLNHATKTNLH